MFDKTDPATYKIWWACVSGWALPASGLLTAWALGGRLRTRWWLVIAVIAALHFPYTYRQAEKNDTDYSAYRSRVVAGQEGAPPYVYSERIAWAFAPLKAPIWISFPIWYAGCVAAYIVLLRRLFRCGDRFPALVVAATVFSGVAFFALLRHCNIAVGLALLCTTPWGSVLAMCVKPYLAVFVVLHAAIYAAKQNGRLSTMEG